MLKSFHKVLTNYSESYYLEDELPRTSSQLLLLVLIYILYININNICWG
jgi:hypothetical protein